MTINITVDSTTPVEDLRAIQALIASLAGAPVTVAEQARQLTEPKDETPKAAPAPAKKVYPWNFSRGESAPKPAPEPEPEETPDDEAAAEYTVQDALAIASPIVSAGRTREVKDCLTQVGAKKVSEVPAEKLGEFIQLLKAL